MQIMMLMTLMQTPADSLKLTAFYERAFNDTFTLSAASGFRENNEHELRLSLLPRGRPGQPRIIAQLRDRYVESYKVLRTDDSSVVIGRRGFYFSMPSLKLFLNPETKLVRKQIDYAPDIGLRAVDDRELAGVLEVPPRVIELLERRPWEPVYDSTHIPMELRKHPMPPSTYDEFARARPRRVEDGYGRDDTILGEQPGPYQRVGSRIWFGKIFYDGEGTSGVGGLGYFDTSTSKYTFFPVPGLADWSVSAILIEEDAAWLGLVGHPEGEDYAGGLIRYDFKSRTSRKFATEEVIHHLVRWQDRLYVATKNGAYMVQGGRLAKRYRVEPNIDNRFIIVTEDLSSRP